MQKSLREGFGLTVTEAMWKGTPVVGGRCGGIKHQIVDGVNGLLVSSVEEAAEAIAQLLTDPSFGDKLGKAGKESVQKSFLMSRELEQHLDLASAFEARFTTNHRRLEALSATQSIAALKRNS
jgi:trehalose synthase